MSILNSNNHGWIICHESFIRKVYSKTKNEEKFRSYAFDPTLFGIFEQFKQTKQEKKEFDSEVKLVQTAYEGLYPLLEKTASDSQADSNGNHEAKCLSNKFYAEGTRYPKHCFLGGNKNDEAITAVVDGENYLFPENCAFYSHDIKDIRSHLQGRLFHFILMDPPWWNKYIRRKRKVDSSSGYSMMYDNELLNIPIDQLLHDDGLICVWCTSAPSHINAIKTVLFPAWDVEYLSQWFWLKVTKFGKPVCSFSQPLGKQPYERIIFGMKKNSARTKPNPSDNKIFMSVPSAIHSHKPPLSELIKPYIAENGDCLDLFARYLLPHWTSYGNEVLKLQHLSLYSEVNESEPEETTL